MRWMCWERGMDGGQWTVDDWGKLGKQYLLAGIELDGLVSYLISDRR